MKKSDIVKSIFDAREAAHRKQQLAALDLGFNPHDVGMCACMGPPPRHEEVDGHRLYGTRRCICAVRNVEQDVQALIDAGIFTVEEEDDGS